MEFQGRNNRGNALRYSKRGGHYYKEARARNRPYTLRIAADVLHKLDNLLQWYQSIDYDNRVNWRRHPGGEADEGPYPSNHRAVGLAELNLLHSTIGPTLEAGQKIPEIRRRVVEIIICTKICK